MKTKAPLRRSRTYKKIIDIKIDGYAPRNWDYQNPKHQIRPEFVLGRYKRKTFFPINKDYPRANLIYSPVNNGYKRELNPGEFRTYALSQIFTVPGAVLIKENEIKDDKSHLEHRKEVEKKNYELINKLMNGDLNIDFLLEQNKYKRNKTFFNFKKMKKKHEKKNININIQENEIKDKNEEVGKIKVNLRNPKNRQKRNKKLGNIKKLIKVG